MGEITNYKQNGLSIPMETTPEKVFNSPKVIKLPAGVQIDMLENIIAETYVKCGQTFNAEDLNMLSCDFQKTIEDDFNWITIEEIRIAFKKGRRKEFYKITNGKREPLDWFGLNLNTFEVWIKAFKDQVRSDEIKKKRVIDKPEEKEMTEEESYKALEDGVVRLMLYFSENLRIPVCNSHIYNHLRKTGRIEQATGEHRDNIIKKAKINLQLENDFMKGVKKAVISESSLHAECKRIQLEEYFKEKLSESK